MLHHFEGNFSFEAISETGENNEDHNGSLLNNSISVTSPETSNTPDPEQCNNKGHAVGLECIEVDTERFEDDRRESKLRQYNLLLKNIYLERKLGKIFD